MKLIHFTDNTYGRSHVVSAEDVQKAMDRNKRLVPLRHQNGVKFSADGQSLRRGGATSILMGYIPQTVLAQVRTMTAPTS